MALFTLGDINFNKPIENRDTLDFLSNRSKLSAPNVYRYPIDIGNIDRAHYMMINIHKQEKSAYSFDMANDPYSKVQRNRIGLAGQTGALNAGGITQNIGSGLGVVGSAASQEMQNTLERFGLDQKFANVISDPTSNLLNSIKETDLGKELLKGVKEVGNEAEQMLGRLNNAKFLRTTDKITDCIALYMPETLNFDERQQFNPLGTGGETLNYLGSLASILSDSVNGKINASEVARNFTPFIAQTISNRIGRFASSPNTMAGVFASAIGGVQNSRLELIYNSPDFRSFQFQFMFYPRSEKEAEEVQKIINILRFHQAPEIMTGTAGYFLVPPSEFDITFFYNGYENPNIPTISTCVLTSLQTDYAPSGFHSFEVPGENYPKMGRTGMPFAIRLTLGFQETEIMTKYNHQKAAGSPQFSGSPF